MKDKIYDNSNIAESYAGVTTPLTFSFARYAYQEVYRHFSKMMGASSRSIRENQQTFEHMIEFIGYRIYYNLNNWYAMLSFFPGYKLSAEFMEKMMGVEKSGPPEEKGSGGFFQRYFFYLPRTILQAIKISLTFLFLGWRMEKFNEHFKQVFYELNAIDLSGLDLHELRDLYTRADDRLLARWRVPIANDFAVMVSTGLTDRLFKKWLFSGKAYSHMSAAANKPLASLDPGNRIMQIVKHIQQNGEIKKLFLSRRTEEEILDILLEKFTADQVANEIDGYLKDFGSRMPSELKLESKTLMENPENLIAIIRSLVNGGDVGEVSSRTQPQNIDFGDLDPIRKILLRWLLRWSGNSIHRRESARFHRTLIFGYVRKIFLEIGKRMEQKSIVKNDRDIFYLTMEEIFSIIDNKEQNVDPILVIKRRKREFAKWQSMEMPRRIESSQSISGIERELLAQPPANRGRSLDVLTGQVASCPNDIRSFSGMALTLKEFDPTANFEDKILVTSQTDPGWTIVFPLLKGIVIERGGMLSHAAIVARELNIPCIVGVHHATEVITNGMSITLDLQNGLIREVC